eukprot:TRINITY_DN3449_c0_g1_i2.p1 TRINITY_DN3449_c0_g1~~TRINITY_DN3449_c0_g1_i2.p1  ORF type:complete len:3344 (+),score=882.14 TRINITY_DN3449_c0_g1_i2:209-10240(+)
MTLPWTRLGSAPAIVKVSNLFLLLNPVKLEEYNEAQFIAREQRVKEKKLMVADLLMPKGDDSDATKKKEEEGFTQKMVTKVVDNVQIFVDKVHIRYEDDTTNKESPFAFGITVESLHIQSTDAEWNPAFLSESTPIVHKIVQLRNLAVYWDSAHPFLEYYNTRELSDIMDRLIYQSSRSLNPPTHHYIVQPISSVLKVVMNKSDIPDLNIPKIVVSIVFDKIGVSLERNQYKDILDMMSGLAMYQRSARFRAFKPSKSPSQAPQQWWHYAYNCIAESRRTQHRYWSVDSIRQSIADRKNYVSLFAKQKRFEQLKKNGLTESDKIQLKSLEERLSYEQLVSFRQMAYAYLKQDDIHRKAQGKKPASANASGWFGWISGSSAVSEDDSISLKLTDDVWREIETAVNSGNTTNNNNNTAQEVRKVTDVPKEYVKIKVNFLLQEGSIELRDESVPMVGSKLGQLSEKDAGKTLVSALFKKFNIDMLMREGSMSLAGGLSTMHITDYMTPNTAYPKIVEADWENKGAEQQQLLKIEFHQNPLDQPDVDLSVKLSAQPLNIVFNPYFVGKLGQFFQNSQPENTESALDGLSSAAIERISNFSNHTLAQLSSVLEAQKFHDVKLNIVAPNVIVPLDVKNRDCAKLILELGKLSFKSDMSTNNKSAIKNRKTEFEESDFYDVFELDLIETQAYVTGDNTDWRKVREGKEKIAIIEKFDVNLGIFLCKVSNEKLTQVKVTGKMPKLQFLISSNRTRNFFRILNSITEGFSAANNSNNNGANNNGNVKALPTARAVAKTAANTANKSAVAKRTRRLFESKETDSQDELLFRQKMQIIAEKTMFQLQFIIPEISLVLSNDTDTPDTDVPLSTLLVKTINITFAQRSFDMTAVVTVRDLMVQDNLQKWGDQFKYLVSSESKDTSHPILTLAYNNIQSSSPEYQGIDQFVDLRIGNLFMIFNRETVVALLRFVNENILTTNLEDKIPEYKALKGKGAQEEEKIIDQGIEVERILPPTAEEVAAEPQQAAAGPTIKVVFRMGMAQLLFNKNGTFLSELALDKSAAEVQLRPDKSLFVDGNIGKIRMVDLIEKESNVYEQVLNIEGERKKMITFQFETYDGKGENYPGFDMRVELKIESIRVFVVQQFFAEMLVYLTEFQEISKIITETASATADATLKVAENIAQTQKTLKLVLAVRSPYIVVPKSYTSLEVLILSLGDIALENEFSLSGTDRFETTKLKVVAINLRIGNLIRSNNSDANNNSKAVSLKESGSPDDADDDKGVKDVMNSRRGKLFKEEFKLTVSKTSAYLLKDLNVDIITLRPIDNKKQEYIDFTADMNIPEVSLLLATDQALQFSSLLESNLEQFYSPNGINAALQQRSTKADETKTVVVTPSGKIAEVTIPSEASSILNLALQNERQSRQIEKDKANGFAGVNSNRPNATSYVRIKFQSGVAIGKFNVDIAQGGKISLDADGNVVSDAESIINLQISGLNVSVRQRSDNSMSAKVLVANATVKDTRREGGQKFVHLFTRADAIQDSTFNGKNSTLVSNVNAKEIVNPSDFKKQEVQDNSIIQVNYAKFGSGAQEVAMVINRPAINVLLEPLFALKDTVLPISAAFSNAFSKVNADVSKTISDTASNVAEGAAIALKEAQIDVRLDIISPEIRAIYDTTKTTSLGFTLRSGFTINANITGGNQKVNIRMNDCELSRTKFQSHNEREVNGSELAILEKFNMQINAAVDNKSSKGGDGMDIEVGMEITKIRITFSMQDQRLGLDFVQKINKTLAPLMVAKEADKEQERKEGKEEKEKDSQSKTSVELTKLSANANRTPNKEKVKVQSEGMDIFLLNDYQGENAPLFELKTNRLEATVENWSSSVHANFNTGGSIDYYNKNLADWEPMIESWSLIATASMKPRPDGKKYLWSTISAPGKLELNVTQSMLSATVKTIEVLTDPTYSSTNEPPDFDYLLINETGHRLRFYIAGDNKEYVVEEGQSTPIPILKLEQKLRRVKSQVPLNNNFIEIALDKNNATGVTFKNVSGIGLDTQGQFEKTIVSDLGDLKLYYEVKLEEGLNTIRIFTTAFIANFCSEPIDALIDVPVSRSKSISVPVAIPAGKSMPIPMECTVAKHNIRIKPSGVNSSLFGYSKESFSLDKVDGKRDFNANILCEDSRGTALYYKVHIQPTPPYQVVISAPFVLKNLLPCALTYRTVSGIRQLDSGAEVNLHEYPLNYTAANPNLTQNNLNSSQNKSLLSWSGTHHNQNSNNNAPSPTTNKTIMFIIDGFDPGPGIAPEDDNVTREVNLVDSNKLVLKLNVSFNKSEVGGATSISVWTPYWLVNKTGLRLIYRSVPESSLHLNLTRGSEKDGVLVPGQKHAKSQGSSAAAATNDAYSILRGEPKDWYTNSEFLNVEPLLFAFPGTGTEYLKFKIAGSQFSQPISLSKSEICVDVLDSHKNRTNNYRMYSVGIYMQAATGQFWRTKVVTFVPYRIITNQSKYKLILTQVGTEFRFAVEPGESIPFYWEDSSIELKMVRLRISGRKYYSGVFPLQMGRTAVRIPIGTDPNATPDSNTIDSAKYDYFRVEGQYENATLFITIKDEDLSYPLYRIDNRTNFVIDVCQRGQKQHDVVQKYTSIPYAWDEQLAVQPGDTPNKNTLMVSVTGLGSASQNYQEITLDEPSGESRVIDIPPSRSNNNIPSKIWLQNVVIESAKSVLITDKEPDDQKRNNTSLGDSSGAARDSVREANDVEKQKKSIAEISMELDYIGISLIDATPRELMYMTLKSPRLFVAKTEDEEQLELVVETMQIDNQLYDTPYPVLLYTTIDEKKTGSSSGGSKNFIHVSVVRATDVPNVEYFRYLSVGVQEMNIKIDTDFVVKFMEYIQVVTDSSLFQNKENVTVKEALEQSSATGHTTSMTATDSITTTTTTNELFKPPEPDQSKMLYFQFFLMNPILFYVTFTAATDLDNESLNNNQMLAKIFQYSVVKTLANIDEVPIGLNALMLENAFLSREDYQTRIVSHYKDQAIRQIFGLIGSADFLGAPVSFVNNIGTGVKDFFYEPAQGIVRSPTEFGKGIANGTTSLVKNSLAGVFGSTGKFTGSLSRGAAALSFDQEYIKKREREKIKDRPNNVVEGVGKGLKRFGKGLFEGATGVVTQPIKGASEEGFEGFLKGSLKGVVGVAAKPVAGTLDLVSSTAEGVKNTAVQKKAVKRIRGPRFFESNGKLVPFSESRSDGRYLISSINHGSFKDEKFVDQFFTRNEGKDGGRDGKGLMVLVTDKSVICAAEDGKGMIWSAGLRELKRVREEKYGLAFEIVEREREGGAFGFGSGLGTSSSRMKEVKKEKELPVEDKGLRRSIKSGVEAAVEQYGK